MKRNQSCTQEDRKSRILVVEDHHIFADLLCEFIAHLPDYQLVGVATDGGQALRMVTECDPDVVVLDLQLPSLSGLEVLFNLRKRRKTKVLILSALGSPEVLRHAIVYGATGFIRKDAGLDDLRKALCCFRKGEGYVSPLLNSAMRDIIQGRLKEPLLDDLDIKVARLFCQGLTMKALSSEVGLSDSGAYKALQRIRSKTRTNSDQELELALARLGVVAVDSLPVPAHGARPTVTR